MNEKAKCEFGKDDCASVGLSGCDNCSLGDCYVSPPTERLTHAEAFELVFDTEWVIAVKIMAERRGIKPVVLHDALCAGVVY